MPRIPFGVAFVAALVALCATMARAEVPIRLDLARDWRHADDMAALVSSLDDWLDVQSDWPRREKAPDVRFVSLRKAETRRGATASLQKGRLRGLYDPDRAEILLTTPWDPGDAQDVSVLLHELVHHRQAPHPWYCPAAQELPAYRLQDAWLQEQGLRANVNWLAVVLDAGCTRRDIHPD
ncbi:MAG: DUF6647 family protein [Roseovarius sp.]